MNEYSVTYKIHPSGIFGVPQKGFTVIPENREIKSHIISPYSLKIIEFGTLSHYRSEVEKINFETQYDEMKIKIKDNFITIYFKENDWTNAICKADQFLNNFLRLLGIFYSGKYFYAELIEFLENDKEIKLPSHSKIYGFKVQIYALEKLKNILLEIFSKMPLLDETAIRCLEYIDRATFLESFLLELDKFDFRTRSFLYSESFLNYYKAINVIVGEPSKDQDYQSRYKKFNISSEFFNNEIQRLWKIRCDYDVAHYQEKEDLEKLQELIGSVDKARKVAVEVLKKYLEYLEKNKNIRE